jgi:hypothetical protein
MCLAQVPSDDRIQEPMLLLFLQRRAMRVSVFLHFTAGDDIPGSVQGVCFRALHGMVSAPDLAHTSNRHFAC